MLAAALACGRQGVSGFQEFGEFIGQDVGIDLRRGDVGVTEKGLHNPEVRPALQQMGRVGMAERVRVDPL